MSRKYIPLDLQTRPCKEGFFYECMKCGDIIPSKPSETIRCTCHNIMIDVDAGRIALLDPAQVRLFEEVVE